MDGKSHEIFAKVLLEVTNRDQNLFSWGRSPDLDLKLLVGHRWYRHRISTLSEIYSEFKLNNKDDKDSIALCVMSHLYLDTFNAWVFPFGLSNPVYPQKGIIYNVINDLTNTNKLIQDLKNMSGYNTFSDMFYAESEGIFREFAQSIDKESIIASFVKTLSMNYGVYEKAINDINLFTEKSHTINTMNYDAFEKLEINYIFLINKAVSSL